MFKRQDQIYNYFDLENFTFHNGTSLPHVRLAYQVIHPHAKKVALISTCFRGRKYSTLNFAKGALQDYRIIIVALFGNGESSSPSNTPGFPELVDYRDCIRAQHALLTRLLDIQSVDVMLGFSMGGQCTYYWTAMYPHLIRNAVIVCSAAQTSLHNYQNLEGPKSALENSIDYAPVNHRLKNLKVARGLSAFGKAYSAWLTSAEWFEKERFKDLGYETLQDWDRDVTNVNYSSWDPDDLLSMLRMWQNGSLVKCISDGKDSLESSLTRIQARVLLMPCQSDQYFHRQASERESHCLKNGTMEIIPSIWGHSAGTGSNQQDTNWIDQKISIFLEAGPRPTSP